MEKFREGDKVKILGLHKDDAFYTDSHEFIGKKATVVNQHGEFHTGYFAGILNIEGRLERFFHAIHIEKVTKEVKKS